MSIPAPWETVAEAATVKMGRRAPAAAIQAGNTLSGGTASMTPLLAVQWIGVAAALIVVLFLAAWLTVEVTVATVMEMRRLGWRTPSAPTQTQPRTLTVVPDQERRPS